MFDYQPSNSLVHKTDVRIKVIIFILLTVITFIYTHPLYNLGIAILSLLIYFTLKIPFNSVWGILKPLLPIFLIIIVISGFTYPTSNFTNPLAKEVLLYGWFNQKLPLTYGGLFFGVSLLFRIFSMVILTSILILSTPLEDFVQMMDVFKFPQPLSFIVITGIRFVPTMQKKVEQVYDAQRSRGAKLSTDGMFSQIFAFIPIMVPLIVDSIRMSDRLAISMLNRGYGASKKRTSLRTLKLRSTDYILLVIAIISFIGLCWIRLNGYGLL